MDKPHFNQDVVTLFMLDNLETLTTFFLKNENKKAANIWV